MTSPNNESYHDYLVRTSNPDSKDYDPFSASVLNSEIKQGKVKGVKGKAKKLAPVIRQGEVSVKLKDLPEESKSERIILNQMERYEEAAKSGVRVNRLTEAEASFEKPLQPVKDKPKPEPMPKPVKRDPRITDGMETHEKLSLIAGDIEAVRKLFRRTTGNPCKELAEKYDLTVPMVRKFCFAKRIIRESKLDKYKSEIRDGRRSGMTYTALAKKYKSCPHKMRKFCIVYGYVQRGTKATNVNTNEVIMKKNIAKIKAMRKEGAVYQTIADKLGVPLPSLYTFCRVNGIRG